MGARQANKPQAGQAFAGAGAAANQSSALGAQYNAQQNQLYNTLFGTGGKGGGTLSGFMNPASLNVSSPTGPYALQYQNTVGNISNSFRNARGGLARDLANRGFGMNSPAYFGASQENQLRQGEASAKGAAFQDATMQSYQDALKNFWGATGMGADVLAGTRAASPGGYTNAGDIYSKLYGTAGQPVANPWMQFLQAGMGAAGQATTGNLGK